MALLIDLAIIATIAFCSWRGYKNGLIRGAFGVVALIASLYIANISAKAYSGEFTDVLRPFVSGVVESTFAELAEENLDFEGIDRKSDAQKRLLSYDALRRIGLPSVSALHLAENTVIDEEDETRYSDVLAEKLCTTLTFVAVFGIGFILLSIVFAIVGNLIGFIFTLPGFKLLDSAAGVLLGFVRGLLITFALATIVRYFGLLAPETLEGTRVLGYFVNNNLIANMLGV